MITAGAITQIADRDGVQASVVERDYVLTQIVDALARSDPPTGLVFKGGTALRLCFYEDFRYSADLDFSLVGASLEQAFDALDVATDELVIRIAWRPLLRRYKDQTDPPPNQDVYAIEEVAAEKLRCVIQRFQCRDVSDLHRLFVTEEVDLDESWALFEEKAAHRGFAVELFAQRLESRSPNYERRWQAELEVHYGPSVPHFERVMRELRRALRSKL